MKVETFDDKDLTINKALALCQDSLNRSRFGAFYTLIVLAFSWLLIGGSIFGIYYAMSSSHDWRTIDLAKAVASQNSETAKNIIDYAAKLPETRKFLLYILSALLTIITGIIISFYRYYLNEVSKYEYLRLGFLRIAVAFRNSSPMYKDIVMIELAHKAFELDTVTKKKGRGDATQTGHPVYDSLKQILEKITEETLKRRKS
jgi:hypothetical protein